VSARHTIDLQAVLALLDPDEIDALHAEHGADGAATLGTRDAAWLLQWLSRRRTPFIKMASDVCTMLTSLEASIRGNIHFVVLSEQAAELSLDFGAQMRAATATALRVSALATPDLDIQGKLDAARRSVRGLLAGFKPRSVTRYDETGQLLRDLADLDPRQRMIRELQAEQFRSEEREFNPADAAGMERVASAAHHLQRLGERLLSGRADQSGPISEAGAGDLRSALREMANLTATSARKARSMRSWDYPQARRTLPDSQYITVAQSLDALRRALLAGSETEAASDELFDFYSLEFWRQRWRLYELWLLARIVAWLSGLGGEICDAGRIVEGRWSLKFTRDTLPVLGFVWARQRFDLYYQYFDATGARANMPDLALRQHDGAFVFVLDPKHGESYSRKDLNEVCLRYAEAFAPAASCVMNYFPRSAPVERLAGDPSCTVLYGIQPDSELLPVLIAEFNNAMQAAWRRRVVAGATIVVLFDISASTADVREVLYGRLRTALHERLFNLSPMSRVLLFGDQIMAEGTIWNYMDGTLESSGVAQGTDFNQAFAAAMDRFDGEPSGEIWLFTDGQGQLPVEEWSGRIRQAGARLRVWEAGSGTSTSQLFELAQAVGGEHYAIH
jgi:hypothetical protein